MMLAYSDSMTLVERGGPDIPSKFELKKYLSCNQ